MAASSPCLMWLALCAALLITGCSSESDLRDDVLVRKALPGNYRDILENSDKFELLSITAPGDKLPDGIVIQESIGEFGVIDGRVIEDREIQLRLIHAFYEAVKNGEDNVGAACFDPHHGIRATKDRQSVTVLVCFMCDNFYALPDGVKNGIRLDMGPLHAWREETRKVGLTMAKTRFGSEP